LAGTPFQRKSRNDSQGLQIRSNVEVLTGHEIDLEMPAGKGAGYHPEFAVRVCSPGSSLNVDEASIHKHCELVIPIHDPPGKFCVFIERDCGF